MDLNVVGSPNSSPSSSCISSSGRTQVNAFAFMLTLVMIYVVVDWILALVTVPYLEATEEDAETGEVYPAKVLYIPPWVLRLRTVRLLWEMVYSIFILVVLYRTRQYVRQRYSIPSTVCGNNDCLEDCCCSLYCGPCSVCQMARHTSDYRRETATCCTSTGVL